MLAAGALGTGGALAGELACAVVVGILAAFGHIIPPRMLEGAVAIASTACAAAVDRRRHIE